MTTKEHHVERKPAKPTAAQIHDGVVNALREMVRECEAAGQRDLPHVVAAREALAQAEQD